LHLSDLPDVVTCAGRVEQRHMDRLPILYQASKTGVQQWRTWVAGAEIFVEHGKVGGKLQVTITTAQAKNVGRANETAPEQQAELEAKALWVHKSERKYCEDPSGIRDDGKFLPMLMPNSKWPDMRKYIKYPAILQPKLDGNRSTAILKEGNVTLTSREGVVQDFLPHINAELKALELPENYRLDGELYCHGETLQTINSWIKKHRPESMRIKYYLYELPLADGRTDLTLKERLDALKELVDAKFINASYIELVPSYIVNSEEEVLEWFVTLREQGYEGACVKNFDGKYEANGARPNTQAKVKPFEDAEFKVIGFTPMKRRPEMIQFICETEDGKPFEVVPNGKHEQLREWLLTGDQFIGKMLTVTFMGRTHDGIPNIAKGKVFRLDSDIPAKAV
jgi:DNA ligase-1